MESPPQTFCFRLNELIRVWTLKPKPLVIESRAPEIVNDILAPRRGHRRERNPGDDRSQHSIHDLFRMAHELFRRHCKVQKTHVDLSIGRPRRIRRQSHDTQILVAHIKRPQKPKILVSALGPEDAEQCVPTSLLAH